MTTIEAIKMLAERLEASRLKEELVSLVSLWKKREDPLTYKYHVYEDVEWVDAEDICVLEDKESGDVVIYCHILGKDHRGGEWFCTPGGKLYVFYADCYGDKAILPGEKYLKKLYKFSEDSGELFE